MKSFLKYIVLFFAFVCLLSCGSNQINPNKPAENKTSEALIKVNQYMIKKDVELIKAYIKRHSWSLTETESGLWIGIYQKNNGKTVKPGNKVQIKYTLELLDGSLCYSSDSLGIKTINLGKGETENGLEEGLLQMKEGESAKMILPPHLAYGLVGDQNCIPARAIIVYDVAMLKIEN
jgi:FKBP-type peptidyl-prolyl cis-trans isomerase FkpA